MRTFLLFPFLLGAACAELSLQEIEALYADGGGGGGSGGGWQTSPNPRPTGGGGGTQTASTCPAIDGTDNAGTRHNARTISGHETWTSRGSPHFVTGAIEIDEGGTLVIEPCAQVVLDTRAYLRAGGTSAGTLRARGTAGRPIVIQPFDNDYHGGVYVGSAGKADLAFLLIYRGGIPGDLNYRAALSIKGDDNQEAPLQQVRVDNLVLMDSPALGLELTAAGGFTDDSRELSIFRSGHQSTEERFRYAALVEPLSLSTLPTGRYEGSAINAIFANSRGAVLGDLHLKNLGIPYDFPEYLSMYVPSTSAAGDVITLTIDPGVVVQLGKGWKLSSGLALSDPRRRQTGVQVVANGTAEAPILFTSRKADPKPGDWVSIDWDASPGTGNSLRHVIFEYGGARDSGANGYGCGPTKSDALLVIRQWVPEPGMVVDSVFRHSASSALVSGWASPQQLPDLSLENTFENIANACQVSRPSSGSYCASDTSPDCFL